MRQTYNKNTFTDTPMDASLSSSFADFDEQKLSSKQKIKAIGNKAKNKLKSNKVNEGVEQEENDFETDLQDLEKLNEENLQNFRYKHRRNKVIIILLSVLLVISLAAVAIYMIIVKLQTNCNMFVYGANASYVINGLETDEFRAPAGIEGNRILKLDIKLKIKESGEFNIKYTPKCYKNGKRLENVLIFDCNFDLFYEGGDGYWYSNESISGNQTIKLCAGVILDGDYESNLTTDNFKLDFYTYLEKV